MIHCEHLGRVMHRAVAVIISGGRPIFFRPTFCDAERLYGRSIKKVHDPEVRARFEAVWKVSLPSTKGLDNFQMIEAIHAGELKAMYLFGEEIALVDGNSNNVEAALAKLEFFVVQDVFFSKTCQFANVIFPASPSLEKEGTFTNTERRIQRLYQVFEPLEGSRPDWRIIQSVANHLGAKWNYQHPSEIYQEIASHWSAR
jgi:formate dehydrogenase major subunit